MVKFTNKQKIVACFVLSIAIFLGGFLWQIDKYERVLLGQEWLFPVPPDVWQKYLDDIQLDKQRVVTDNQDIIDLIKTFRKTDSHPNLVMDDMKIITSDPNIILSKEQLNNFKKSYPNEFNRWVDTYLLAMLSRNEPKPSNPSNSIILHEISSLYRYLFAVEGILVFSLFLFIFLYKEPKDTTI